MSINTDLFDNMPSQFDGPELTDDMVVKAERILGYRLPSAYVDVLRIRNGGFLNRCYYHTPSRTFDVFALIGIGGVEGMDSFTDSSGRQYDTPFSKQMIEGWNFPDTGVVITVGGHCGYLLDDSQCGPVGEPMVIHVNSEQISYPEVTFVAPDFATLVAGLTERPEPI